MQKAMNAGVITCVQLTQDYLDRIAAYDPRPSTPRPARALNSILATGGRGPRRGRGQRRGPRGERRPAQHARRHPDPAEGQLRHQGHADDGRLRLLGGQPDLRRRVHGHRACATTGAVILGKASLDEFAFGFASAVQLRTSPAGTSLLVASPYNTSKTAGGSSGGTGASISANLGAIGFGTDTGGSIRNPSSYNQLVGVRPTVGLPAVTASCRSRSARTPAARSPARSRTPRSRSTRSSAPTRTTRSPRTPTGNVPDSYTSFLDGRPRGQALRYFTSMVPRPRPPTPPRSPVADLPRRSRRPPRCRCHRDRDRPDTLAADPDNGITIAGILGEG